MSRQWVRNVPNGKASKPHTSIAKASGDLPSTCTRPNPKQNERVKSSKIPKSVRYDLENALVGLCDLWFEEIKPHLIRNNIKLHVDTDSAGPAGDDHSPMPAVASGCSHNNPAESSRDCQLCRLLFQASHSIESAVSQAASAVSSAGGSSTVIAPTNDSENKITEFK